jgi:hypothetical protein
VESNIVEEWLEWMKTVHIPEVMSTGLFDSSNIYRVLLQEESDVTFSVQYTTDTLAQVQQYLAHFAPDLRDKLTTRFGYKVAAFRTVLESV